MDGRGWLVHTARGERGWMGTVVVISAMVKRKKIVYLLDGGGWYLLTREVGGDEQHGS